MNNLPADDDERLMLVAQRELKNLEERRARRAAEVALREAEKRCQLLLDSSVPNEPWGHLAEAELALVDETLSRHPAPHALLFLHHHPVPVGSPWIDRIALRNADALFATLDRHAAKVRGVVFGHVHQAFEAERDAIQLVAAPATCIQFASQTDRLIVDDLPPGYRWLDLHADGRIETGVRYLEDAALRATA